MTSLSFNKTGYDPFIDFLKAFSIFCVILAHNLPTSLWNYCQFRLWAGTQVSMFILIQVFHAYKKEKRPTIKWASLLKRIVLPFVFVQIVILLFRSLFACSFREALIGSIKMGGYGPGSYYFWIYLQMAIIFVLIWPLVKKLTLSQLTLVFLLFSVGCEVLFSVINLPDAVYRLLAVRYVFLIPLAYGWVKQGVVLNVKSIALSLISIAAVVFFSYNETNLEPFFYNTGWTTHRWICYFYIPVLLTYLLWLLFNRMRNVNWVSSIVKELARSSYEIFCVQMLVFVVLPITRFTFIQSTLVRVPVWMILTFALSVVGGVSFNRLLQKVFVVQR